MNIEGLEFYDDHPSLNIAESEYVRLLGYPIGHQMDDRPKELAQMSSDWYTQNGKPWIYGKRISTFELTEQGFSVEGIPFISSKLKDRFSAGKAHEVFVIAVSAGKECEEYARQLWKEQKPDEYFFMEMYGSAVVEYLVSQASIKLCTWADQNNLAVLPHYSPGYPNWDISDQNKLLDLIKSGFQEDKEFLIDAFDTGMLKPKKSLLAVFGVTKHQSELTSQPGMIPCEKCSLPGCQYRRKAYKFAATEQMNESTIELLNQEVNYSISIKALKKWSEERLVLDFEEEGVINADFLYEGTTCSNFGHALKFEYRVKLSITDLTILESLCNPAPDDLGHDKMCQYIKDPTGLMDRIQTHQDFVGKSLNSIFDWEREYNPSACFCDKSSRDYKWGMVLEVIHYALAKKGIDTLENESMSA